MDSQPILNLDALLAPISQENPCGIDFRTHDTHDNLYKKMRDARSQARLIERNQGLDTEQTDSADKHWGFILETAPFFLAEQSKDIEVCCWLIEALVRQYGFKGLKEGLQLLQYLTDMHWDNLFPRADEDGDEIRVAPINGLNGYSNEGALIAPIYMSAMTPQSANEVFSAWDYMQAEQFAKYSKESGTNTLSLEAIRSMINAIDKAFYADLIVLLGDIQNTIQALDKRLNAQCQDDNASLGNIKKAIEKCKSIVVVLTQSLFIEVTESYDKEEELAASTDGITDQSVASRDQAIRNIRAAAEYFKQFEPHSPIGYVLQRLIRWSDMDLSQLLPELIDDPNAQYTFSRIVGINPPAPLTDIQHTQADESFRR